MVSFFQGSNQSKSGKHFFSLQRIMYPPSIEYCTQFVYFFTSCQPRANNLPFMYVQPPIQTRKFVFIFWQSAWGEYLNKAGGSNKTPKELHSLYSYTNIIRMIKWWREWKQQNLQRNWERTEIPKYGRSEVLKVRDSFKHFVINGKIILKFIWINGAQERSSEWIYFARNM